MLSTKISKYVILCVACDFRFYDTHTHSFVEAVWMMFVMYEKFSCFFSGRNRHASEQYSNEWRRFKGNISFSFEFSINAIDHLFTRNSISIVPLLELVRNEINHITGCAMEIKISFFSIQLIFCHFENECIDFIQNDNVTIFELLLALYVIRWIHTPWMWNVKWKTR